MSSSGAIRPEDVEQARSFAFSRGLWGSASPHTQQPASSSPQAPYSAPSSPAGVNEPTSGAGIVGTSGSIVGSPRGIPPPVLSSNYHPVAPSVSASASAAGSLYGPSPFDAPAPKFAPQVYRNGSNVWGSASSASGSRRPSRSHTEPDSKPQLVTPLSEYPRRASLNGPPPNMYGSGSAPKTPFLASIMPLSSGGPFGGGPGGPTGGFAGPTVSIMDQFGSLADATRQAELAQRMDRIKLDSTAAISSAPVAGTANTRGVKYQPGTGFQPGQQGSQFTPPMAPVQGSDPGSPAAVPWAVPHRVPSVGSIPGLVPSNRPTNSPLQRDASSHTNLAAESAIIDGGLLQEYHSSTQHHLSATSQSVHADAAPRNNQQRSMSHSHPSGSASDEHIRSGSAGEAQQKRPVSRKKDWKRGKRFDSPFLEDLRSHSRPIDMSEVLGRVADVSVDQHGSRFIQEHLMNSPPDVRRRFFDEALSNATPLMTDVFGNYVIQMLFEHGEPDQRSALVNQMLTHILTLSLQMYGCRVVQMAIRYSPESEQVAIVNELRSNVLRCIKDHNGNHVIQKAIECVPPRHVQFVYSVLMSRTVELSRHSYGCRVVQRVLEHGDAATKAGILSEMRVHVSELTLDRYGNYVIQHVVDNGPVSDRDHVFDKLLPDVIRLSRHKYASNVVEKLFIRGKPAQRSQMIQQILSKRIDGVPAIVEMVKDQYANYVVQKILDTTEGDDYTALVAAIRPHLDTLRQNSYGKHLTSIKRLLGEVAASDGT